LLWFAAAAAGGLAGADGARAPFAGGASAEELLARALDVIERQSARVDELTRQNTELRALVARQAGQLAEANETIAVLQRIVFGGRRRSPARLRTAAVVMVIPVPATAGSRAAGRRSR